jgi:hypothetical protein
MLDCQDIQPKIQDHTGELFSDMDIETSIPLTFLLQIGMRGGFKE